MSKIITVPFTENFLSHVVDYIYRSYERGGDLSRLAVVFGGRRPSLFIKRDLARRIGKAFVPPRFFTIDEWMAHVAYGPKPPAAASDLDHAYTIYQLVKELCPGIAQGRESFAQFLPWAMEILHFIEQLDLEDVPYEALNHVKEHAKIGLSVPEDINKLLIHVGALRKAYHQQLQKDFPAPRGYQYLQASQRAGACDLSAFDEILFCNFFYLHQTESKVIKHIYDRMPTVLFMQGDQRRWPALKRIADTFGTPILEGAQVASRHFDLKIYEAFDSHAQAGLVHEILDSIKDPESTVIVLPNSDFLLTLLTAIGSKLEAFNVSMGYPLKRSALYTLLSLVIEAQNHRRDGLYYARDYLNILQHPLVKGLDLGWFHLGNVLAHTATEVLQGELVTETSGRLFLELETVIKDEKFLDYLLQSLLTMDVSIPVNDLKEKIRLVHKIFFHSFENVHCPRDLAGALDGFVLSLQNKSSMAQYALNAAIALKLQEKAEEFSSCRFANENFDTRDLFRILQEQLSGQMVAFSGSPLRGLQILGLFETRSLNFKHVVVVDANEGTLPILNIYEPLIPREVMIQLNLQRLELEEEIQRYGFMRLIAAAQEVHLIYQQNNNRAPRSRFVEELIWEKEQGLKAIGSVAIMRGDFEVSVEKSQRSIPKSPAIVDTLKNFKFSASSVNTYLQNPYLFYCQYVLNLKLKDDLLETPEERHIGIFIHDLLQEAFKVFVGKKPVIDEHFRKYFQKIYESRFAAAFARAGHSDTFLMEAVLKARLERFLDLEALRCESQVKKVLFIEKKFEDTITLAGAPVRWTYRVDRVDEMMDGSILIVDYKTGAVDPKFRSLSQIDEALLGREYVHDHIRSFQMPLYTHYLHRVYPGLAVNSALYYLRTMRMDFFLNPAQMKDSQYLWGPYVKALDFIMAEIFNPEIPFIEV